MSGIEIGYNFDALVNGDEEMSGVEIGQLARSPTAFAQQLASALRGSNKPAVRMTGNPSFIGERSIGVRSLAIAASTTVDIEIKPQQDFKPERFVYTGPANKFDIQNVLIMQKSQFAGSGAQRADAYNNNSVGVRVGWDTIPINVPAIVTVTNLDGGAAQDFTGVLFGKTAA